MQWLLELIAAFVVMLASAGLAQFGVDSRASRQADREVHRVAECADRPAPKTFAASNTQDC